MKLGFQALRGEDGCWLEPSWFDRLTMRVLWKRKAARGAPNSPGRRTAARR